MPVMVRFRVGDGVWLAAVEQVLEVRKGDSVRPLPDARAGVTGVIDRDGHALPVVRALGGGGRHVLVVQAGDEMVGVLADEVTGVADVDPGDLRPRPAGQGRPYVEATCGEGNDLAYVLDASELVRDVATPMEIHS